MILIRITKACEHPSGIRYREGESMVVLEAEAEELIRAGAAVRLHDSLLSSSQSEKAMTRPNCDKMIDHSMNK